jgi:PAS domain S-box-containing protein
VTGLQSLLAEHVRVFDALPIVAWIGNPEGTATYISPAWEKYTGIPAADALQTGFSKYVHPDDLPAVLSNWSDARAAGVPYRDVVRLLFSDGSFRWVVSEANPLRDAAGTILGWVGTATDVHDRVIAEEALATQIAMLARSHDERERFAKLAETSRDIIGITDAAGRIVYVNPAAAAFFETTREDFLGLHFFDCFLADDLAFVKSAIVPTLEAGGRWAGDLRFRNRRTGRALPVTCDAFAMLDASGDITGFATISRDQRERQRTDIAMRALADAGKAMHESLDFDATMQNIADATVAGFANACSVEVSAPGDRIRTITLGTRDPADAPIAWRVSETRNAGMPYEHPIRWAIRDGISTLKQVLDAPFLASTGIDRHLGAEPGKLDICSLIFVPIRSPRDGRIYGSLSLGLYSGDPRGHYVEDDVRFAEEIGARAGLAFDNAYAYERTRRVAVEMQAASLPSSLPQSSDVRIHAEYRPATDEATIGGDWYDAFRLPDGRIAMTIGDVVGHGLQAATWMTRMRQAMQAAAMLDPDPCVMLGVANRTLVMQEREVYATAMAAIYDASARTLHVASAGHPGPVVARGGGGVEDVRCRGCLLGIENAGQYDVAVVEIEPGDLVVFYTDGLVELERDIEVGQARLRDALRLAEIREAPNPALAIFERVLAGASAKDDVAILTLHAVATSAR